MHLGSLLNGREDEFSRDLYNLSQRPIFDVIAFEDLVDKIRSCVAEVIVCIVCHLLEILLTSATTDSLEYYLGALLVTAPNRCSSDCYEHRNRCIVLSMLRTGGCLLSLTSQRDVMPTFCCVDTPVATYLMDPDNNTMSEVKLATPLWYTQEPPRGIWLTSWCSG